MFEDVGGTLPRKDLALRVIGNFYAPFLRAMKESKANTAVHGLKSTLIFIASGLIRFSDLDGVDLKHKNASAEKKIPALHTLGNLKSWSSKQSSLSAKNQIRVVFLENGINANDPLDELFAAAESHGSDMEKVNRVEAAMTKIVALLDGPGQALRHDYNVVQLPSGKGGKTPTPQ